MKRRTKMIGACVLLAMPVVQGCNEDGLIDFGFRRADTGEARLERMSSAVDWLDYFREQVRAQRERQDPMDLVFLERGSGPIDFAAPQPVAAFDGDAAQSAPVSGAAGEAGAGSAEFSGTNLQVAGVDEADVVKSDGRYLYSLVGDELRIVEIYPLERLGSVTTLTIEDAGYGTHELYLHNDRLVAIHQVMEPFPVPEPRPGLEPIGPVEFDETGEDAVRDAALSIAPVFSSKTAVTIIDVGDPEQPAVVARWDLDGYAVSSRMIAGTLHLVLTQHPYIPFDFEPEALTVDDIEAFIPKYTLREGAADERSGELVKFQDFYRPVDPDGLAMTTVVSIDVTAEKQEFDSVAVIGDPGTVFASTEALYLSDPDFDYFYTYRDTLDIHKFSLRGGRATYVASGSVEGRLLNQFSLGEYQGHLCVATTTGTPWAWDETTSKNHVFVLQESDGVMSVVGAVENLAPGERIYAARFVGDTGFLVTFRQVDPLFTIDLSNPSKPQMVGELKVPGFSEYIHVLDEDHLLTLGRSATLDGRALGLQLSIFDVSNLSDPRLVTSHEIGSIGTSSEAEWNHKAFTFYPQENLLALPVTLYQQVPGQPWGEFAFAGLFVYHVTPEEGFTLRGQIATIDTDLGYPVYGGWTRGLFIEDHVYAATELGVKAATITSPGVIVGEVQLAEPDSRPPIFIAEDVIVPEAGPDF